MYYIKNIVYGKKKGNYNTSTTNGALNLNSNVYV